MSTTDNFKMNFTRTMTVTSAKISSVFTDEVSSASTDTSHLQAVQRRYSAAPGISNVRYMWLFNCEKHEVSELISCESRRHRSLTGQNSIGNDLSTVAVPTGTAEADVIVAENGGRGYIYLYWGEVAKVSSMSGVERSPSKRAHLAGGPWHSESFS
jgi:hypothetical protein